VQFVKAVHCVDEHARLRLECQSHLAFRRMVAETPAAIDEPVHQDRFSRVIRGRTGPEADRVGAQISGDIHGATQKMEASIALVRVRTDERRLVFASRIKQEPRPGFDYRTQTQAVERVPDHSHLLISIFSEGIKGMTIQGKSDAAIAKLSQDRERILEPMMGKTVGVVSEK
jgi:hypothetical protein